MRPRRPSRREIAATMAFYAQASPPPPAPEAIPVVKAGRRLAKGVRHMIALHFPHATTGIPQHQPTSAIASNEPRSDRLQMSVLSLE